MTSHSGLIYTLSLLRTGVGAISLLSPSLTAAIFGLEINRGAGIVSRLFGAREIALGMTLWYINSRQRHLTTVPTSQEYQHLKALLAVGLCIDVVDSMSSLVSIWEGSMSGKAVWLVGGAAAAASCLGAGLLKTM